MPGLTAPLISLVVPTRDRPEFVATTLEGLSRQTFRDFEVVVSDNALHRPFGPSHRLFDGVRFRYVRPPRPVWMTDHWEFAVAQARGRYVGVLGDKSTLVSTALEQVAAEIENGSPDAISWQTGNFRPEHGDLSGPGEVQFARIPQRGVSRVEPLEALEYLLAVYLTEPFAADHQKEIRGSLYHGIYSARLLDAMKSRFGRVFHFFAPDLTAQCAGMQIARDVAHITRPLELIIAGPSNGVALSSNVGAILGTQEEAARGASGLPPALIEGVSTSVAHALACDLMAVARRTPQPDEWATIHRKAARDLYTVEGWANRSAFRGQQAALWASAERFGGGLRRQLIVEGWMARRAKARARIAARIRKGLGERVSAVRRLLPGAATFERRRFDHLFQALDALG
jgi:hypothetical protein